LPYGLKSDLRSLSQEQNKPVSDNVGESIRRYVAGEKFRALRKKALPFAEAQGFLADDDVFRAISWKSSLGYTHLSPRSFLDVLGSGEN
jgi:hypothetical protein